MQLLSNSVQTIPGQAPSNATRGTAARRLANASAALEKWLGASFTILDTESSRTLHQPSGALELDWSVFATLLPAVGRQNHFQFVAEEGPLCVVVMPVASNDGRSIVAAGLILTERVDSPSQIATAAKAFGVSEESLLAWACRQTVQDAATVERLGALAIEKLRSDLRADQLQDAVDQLSAKITSAFEEISLIYRVTQNLKISENKESLGQLVVSWLHGALPADGIAIQFRASDLPSSLPGRSLESTLWTAGNCPLDNAAFTRLVSNWGHEIPHRPVVMNRAAIEAASLAMDDVRELVLVPLAEGKRLFGWLAAFNHVEGLEFGTVEASLVSSIGSILGIHSSNLDLYRQQADDLAGVVRAMSLAIDAKDPYTHGHSDRVAQVSVKLAQEMGCDIEVLKTLYLGGLLHDIGKIGIDDNVLRKPGKLTDAEYEHVKQHAEIGYRILRDLRSMAPVLPIVLHHHESWDGSGYPYGLSGENIPYLARIVAVADAYDAMASDRPYRAGMPDDKLDTIMRAGAGKQWDQDIVAAFFRARQSIREISRRETGRMEMSWLQLS